MAAPFVFSAGTPILEALELDPEKVGAALKRLGLKCVGKGEEWCAAVAAETLADAARYHEVPLEKILAELNALAIVPKK
jgi:hypothetical protein